MDATRPAVVALMCVLGIASPAWSAGRDAASPSQLIQVAPDPSGTPRTMQPLTGRQKRQVRRIVARDPRFNAIVAPHSFRYETIVPWGVTDRRPRLHREVFIGAFMQVHLEPAKPSVVAGFPLISYPPSKRPDYRIRTLQLTVHGLRSTYLYVDLKRRKLAGISIGGADQVIPPPGYKPPPPKPH